MILLSWVAIFFSENDVIVTVPPLCLPSSYTSLQSVVVTNIFYYTVFVVRRTQRDNTQRPLLHWCRVRFCYFNCVTLFFNFLSHYFLFLILRALASLSLERLFDVLLISSITSSSMDRYLSSPNFDATRPRSNSLSHDPYYFFSVSAPCYRRNAVHISSPLPPLHPISTTHEIPCTLPTVHAVYSPTTVCNSPQTNDT